MGANTEDIKNENQYLDKAQMNKTQGGRSG
jgi:hypothetical protein